MMDYGFGDFRYFKLLDKGKEAGSIKVKGSFKKIKGVLEEDLVLYGNFEEKDYSTEAVFDDLELPVKAGQKIGTLNIYGKGKIVNQVELISKNDISKSWLTLLKDKIAATFL